MDTSAQHHLATATNSATCSDVGGPASAADGAAKGPALADTLEGEKLSKLLVTNHLRVSFEKIQAVFARNLGVSVTAAKRLEPGGMVNAVYFVSAADAEYVLRLSGTRDERWRSAKTLHEVACYKLLAQHGIKVPKVLCYADTADELGFEYIVMERAPGKMLGELYPTLSIGDKETVVRNIGAVVAKMRSSIRFPQICGFSLDKTGAVVPAPVLELGPDAVFSTCLEFVKAQMRCSLADLAAKADPRWTPYLPRLASYAASLSDTDVPEAASLVFTHSDLNCENVMVCPKTLEVTLLDMEWAGMRPSYWEDIDDLDLDDEENGLPEDRVLRLLAESGYHMPAASDETQIAALRRPIDHTCGMLHHSTWFKGRQAESDEFVAELISELEDLLKDHPSS